MSKGKMKARTNNATTRRSSAASRKARQNTAKHSVFLFWFTAIALVLLFVGRWVYAIQNGYYGAFVELDASAASAVGNMKGLTPTADEKALMLPAQKQWDLFAAARLLDEVSITASDGTALHGRLYNEGASVTAVVLPRFHQDGTQDFLPGPYLNELTGCNILLIEPRLHGDSGGAAFTYGVKEKYDLAAWLAWADETLGPQTFILWGEGAGANTALMAAAEDILPASVAFIVAESPYASLHTLAKDSIWKWYSVPAFPFLNAIEGKLSRSGAGFTVSDIELTPLLSGSGADIPALFLTSEGDTYISPTLTQAVADAYPGYHDMISGGGSHGTVYAAAQEEIDAALAQWWAYLKG